MSRWRWAARPFRAACVLPVFSAVVIAGAGCSPEVATTAGSSPVPQASEEQELIDDITAWFDRHLAGEPGTTEGECVGAGVMMLVDADELEESGVVDDGHLIDPLPAMDETMARIWVAVFDECSDFVNAATEQLVAAAGTPLDRQILVRCLRSRINQDDRRAAQVGELTGEPLSLVTVQLQDDLRDCAQQAATR